MGGWNSKAVKGGEAVEINEYYDYVWLFSIMILIISNKNVFCKLRYTKY